MPLMDLANDRIPGAKSHILREEAPTVDSIQRAILQVERRDIGYFVERAFNIRMFEIELSDT